MSDNSWLDGLLGLIKVGSTALTKRNVLRISTGLTAVDDATNEETVLSATGGVIGGQTVGTLTDALLGWFLGYNGSQWIPYKGLREVARGTFTLNSGTPVNVACSAIEQGDVVLWSLKAAVADIGVPYLLNIQTSTKFVVVDAMSRDTAEYYYYVMRPATIPA